MCSLKNQYVHDNGLRFELVMLSVIYFFLLFFSCFFFFFEEKKYLFEMTRPVFRKYSTVNIVYVYSIIKIDGCCIEHKWCLQCICKYNLNLKTCIFTFLSERVLVNYHRIIMFTDLRYIMQLILRKIGWNNRISEEKCFYLYNAIWLCAKFEHVEFFSHIFFFFFNVNGIILKRNIKIKND